MASQGSQPKISQGKLTLSGDRIFFTIQGEGDSIGKPAVFIRLHLCNLSCQWCDTPYTWDQNNPGYWEEWTQADVISVVKEIKGYPCERLVITGGEPLLQQKSIIELTKQLNDWEIEIETNGTIEALSELKERCQFNISPKLSNSNVAKEKRINIEILKSYIKTKSFYKFVVNSVEDLTEIKQLIDEANLPLDRIIAMPQGVEAQSINVTLQSLAESCKNLGIRLLPRMHVQIWGNKRAI